MGEMLHFNNDAEISNLVEKFESCALASGEFTHAHHLAVLVCYLSRMSERDALNAMRSGLLRISARHKVPALYHETITAFWVRLVNTYLQRRSPIVSLHPLANEVVSTFGDKDLIFDYYSRGRLLSPQARTHWVVPDLRQLDLRPKVSRSQSTIDR